MLAEQDGDMATARSDFSRAVSTYAALGVIPDEAYALAGLGRCMLALGETEEGAARLREARELWVGLKATPRIAEIDALLATVA